MYELRDYQVQDAQLLEQGSAALWLEQRLGKTRIVGHAYWRLSDRRERPYRMLVVCPAIALEVWRQELLQEMELPVELKLIRGQKPISHVWWDEFSVLLINYELLQFHAAELMRWNPEIIVFDEAHRLSNPHSAQYKAAKALSTLCERVWLLTGTPWVNSSLDLYHQLRLLGPQADPFYWQKLAQFGDQYAFKKLNRFKPQGYDYRGLKNEQELMASLRQVAVRRLRSEIREFNETKIRLPVWLAEVEQKAPEQIGDLERLRSELSLKKAELTIQYVEEEIHERPLVIFGWHGDYLDAISRHFGCPVIDGDTPQAKRAALVGDFQAGLIPILALNIKSAGVGIRLSRASQAVFGELHWSAVDHRQAEDRLIDEKAHVTYHYLMCSRSIEQRLWRTVLGKGAAMDRLNQAGINLREVLEVA